MTNSLIYVLDTSIIISALLLPRSLPRQAFDLAYASGMVIASVATIDELSDVLRRKKFDRYVREEERLLFLATYIRDVTVIDISETITDCRDPKDNKFLELAVSGRASHLLTGDTDLLSLHPFRGIAIVTPQAFLAIAQEGA